ncbi:MAG: hypothetical protein LAN71_17550, partial [Acidobacteriia bacterium]|nr:hypothetical protein [Terriglobia bacterium]
YLHPSGLFAATGNWVQGSPTLADLDGDGRLEVIVPSRDHWLYVWRSDGTGYLNPDGKFGDFLAPCISCYSRFKAAQYDIERNPELRKQVDEIIGYTYQDRVAIKSTLDILEERVGLEAIAKRVKKPLRDLKVVAYYGCLQTRPPKVTGADHPENPMGMDRIVEKLGAAALDWSFKTDCCGGSLSLTRTDIVLNLTRKILDNARAVGADALVTGCPLCHVNLDTRQDALKLDQPMPILFITQLMGLAFGLEPHALGLEKHLVDTRGIVARAQ